jgi:hypothetical protein
MQLSVPDATPFARKREREVALPAASSLALAPRMRAPKIYAASGRRPMRVLRRKVFEAKTMWPFFGPHGA